MDDLIPWLRARITADAEIAAHWPDAIGPPPQGHSFWQDANGHPIVEPRKQVLARCEALTAILDLHSPRREHTVDGDLVCPTCVSFLNDEDQGGNRFRSREHEEWPCQTIRALALTYQHHPGYREEW